MHLYSIVSAGSLQSPAAAISTLHQFAWLSFCFGTSACDILTAEALQVEISLQPWRVFKPDGVILFSDILTPLTGMGIPFDIEAGRGPIIHTPIRTMQVGLSLLITRMLPSVSTLDLGWTSKPDAALCSFGCLAVCHARLWLL